MISLPGLVALAGFAFLAAFGTRISNRINRRSQ